MGNEEVIEVSIIAGALQSALPQELAGEAYFIAELVVGVLKGGSVSSIAQDKIRLQTILQALAGKKVHTPSKFIYFGEANQFGDVSVGNIVGGNIINIQLFPKESHESVSINERQSVKTHKSRIFVIHTRRLAVLEEQAAMFGSFCPPHILLEIEDIKAKLTSLVQETGNSSL